MITSPPPTTAPETEAVAPGGLRERHKRTTRRLLQNAGLRLFARDGFDNTTVEAIAAEAGVSPRTFFRYFTAKDQVLAPEKELRQEALRAAVIAQPPGLSDLAAAVAALVRIAPTFEAERETMALRRRAALTSPVLRGRLYDVLRSWELATVEALVERRDVASDDRTAEMSGATAIALWQHAVQRWLADDGSDTDLGTELRRAHESIGRA